MDESDRKRGESAASGGTVTGIVDAGLRKVPPAGITDPGYNDGGVDVNAGAGLGSPGDGETDGDGVAKAVASLFLASSSSFFSSP